MSSKFLECDPPWLLTRLQPKDWTSEGEGTAEDTWLCKSNSSSVKHSAISPDQTVETDFSGAGICPDLPMFFPDFPKHWSQAVVFFCFCFLLTSSQMRHTRVPKMVINFSSSVPHFSSPAWNSACNEPPCWVSYFSGFLSTLYLPEQWFCLPVYQVNGSHTKHRKDTGAHSKMLAGISHLLGDVMVCESSCHLAFEQTGK